MFKKFVIFKNINLIKPNKTNPLFFFLRGNPPFIDLVQKYYQTRTLIKIELDPPKLISDG